MTDQILTRRCCVCNEHKPISAFPTDNDPARKLKIKRTCRECDNARRRANYQRRIEIERANKAAYREANPTAWRDWARRAPDKIKAKIAKRKSHCATPVSTELRAQVLTASNNQCLCCGATDDLQIDHIVPASKGGLTVFDNLQALCARCNARKKDQQIDYRAR